MAIHPIAQGILAHDATEVLDAWLQLLGLSCFTGLCVIAAFVAVVIWKARSARRLERRRIESLVRETHRDNERPPGIL